MGIGVAAFIVLGALLFLTGVILVNFGLMGELLVRTWHESQGKPTYVLKETRPALLTAVLLFIYFIFVTAAMADPSTKAAGTPKVDPSSRMGASG